MVTNKKLETGARAIAGDLQLPGGGSKKIARVVADHLDWFDEAEARGMTWSDMVRLLTGAGAVGNGGKPLSLSTLSSTVWRKRAERAILAQTPLKSRPSGVSKQSKFQSGDHNPASRSVFGTSGGIEGAGLRGGSIASAKTKAKARKSKAPQHVMANYSSNGKNVSSAKSDLISFMNRAAASRRRAVD